MGSNPGVSKPAQIRVTTKLNRFLQDFNEQQEQQQEPGGLVLTHVSWINKGSVNKLTSCFSPQGQAYSASMAIVSAQQRCCGGPRCRHQSVQLCSSHDVISEEETRKSEAQMAAAPPQSFAFSCGGFTAEVSLHQPVLTPLYSTPPSHALWSTDDVHSDTTRPRPQSTAAVRSNICLNDANRRTN